MIILCPVHGRQIGVLVSEDIFDLDDRASIVHVEFEENGRVEWSFYLSPQFAAARGIAGGRHPLPPAPQNWVPELLGCCEECVLNFRFEKLG